MQLRFQIVVIFVGPIHDILALSCITVHVVSNDKKLWIHFFCVWIIKMTHFILTNVYCSPQTSDTHLSSSKRMKSFPLLLFVVPAMFFCPQLREWSHMNCPWPVGSLAPWAKWQGPAGWTLKLPNTFTADSSGPAGWPVLAVVGHFS